MRVLAVSYVVPPMLYPQAIQIGRLLSHTPGEIAVVSSAASGSGAGSGLDVYPDFEAKLALHIGVPPERPAARLPPMCVPLISVADKIARRVVPFYGRIPDEHRSWVPPAERAVIAALARSGFSPEVMVTFGEPMSDHLLGLRLKPRLGVPWIAHFSDPWADNPFRRHEIFANMINRRLERHVITQADRIIFTSDETRSLVMKKYPRPFLDKADVLPHSFDQTLYPAPRERERERGERAEPSLRVRYLGSFYGHRTPKPLFQALRLILDRTPALLHDVAFELVGGMPDRMKADPVFRALPESLIRLRGTVPYSASLTLMADADLLLVIDGPDTLSVFLPSKLIDYLGAGVPIFGIVPPGTSAKLITRLGGVVANPSAPAEVADGLVRALARARQQQTAATATPWGVDAVRDEFTIGNVSAKFARIMIRATTF